MKLLLVEDEERLARHLTRGLTEEGHQVDVCATGADALAQGLSLDYDVAILDWTLPDLDGLRACESTDSRLSGKRASDSRWGKLLEFTSSSFGPQRKDNELRGWNR